MYKTYIAFDKLSHVLRLMGLILVLLCNVLLFNEFFKGNTQLEDHINLNCNDWTGDSLVVLKQTLKTSSTKISSTPYGVCSVFYLFFNQYIVNDFIIFIN